MGEPSNETPLDHLCGWMACQHPEAWHGENGCIVPGRIVVRSAWHDLRLPGLLRQMRHEARTHLDHLVRSAEQRLGLPITDRPSFVA